MAEVVFNEMYQRMISQIRDEDLYEQQQYLSIVEEQRHISVEYLLKLGCFFVPNNEYIRYHIGEMANNYSFGWYIDNECLWNNFVILPVYDLLGSVVGVTGWDAYNKYLEVSEGKEGLRMYRHSSANVFTKEKYFFCDPTVLHNTFASRTVFICDGVFDAVALNYRGIPAIALLGSTFSKENLFFLRWYKNIYVCADNDTAGLELYAKLAKSVSGVYRVMQNKTKDIEELLRSDGINGPITQQLVGLLKASKGYDVVLKL